jgi:branched-chain amino acid transport system permease protein
VRIGVAKENYAADEALFDSPTQRFWFGVLLAVLIGFPFLGSKQK